MLLFGQRKPLGGFLRYREAAHSLPATLKSSRSQLLVTSMRSSDALPRMLVIHAESNPRITNPVDQKGQLYI